MRNVRSYSTLMRPGLSLCAAALVAGVAGSAQAVCDLAWSDQFGLPGVDGFIADSVVWDDGTGPALYAVGRFSGIGGIPTVNFLGTSPLRTSGSYNVAKWDGEQWQIVGNPIYTRFDPIQSVLALSTIAVFDPDGPGGPQGEVLVVGGIANPNAEEPHVVLQFDGAEWSRLGSPIGGAEAGEEVRDLEVYNGELYACGYFTSWGYYSIAKYDPSLGDWSALGSDFGDVGFHESVGNTNVRAERMAVYNGELYVGGTFSFASSYVNGEYTIAAANRLIKWNGSSWSAVPDFVNTSTAVSDITGGPTVLKTVDYGQGPALLVGDARYTGTTSRGAALAQLQSGVWSTIVPQIAAPVGDLPDYKAVANAVAVFNSQLHVGGSRLVGGVPGNPNVGASFVRRSGAGVLETLDDKGRIDWMIPVDWDFAGAGQTKLLVGINQLRAASYSNFRIGDLHTASMALWNGTSAEIAHSGSGALGLGGDFAGGGDSVLGNGKHAMVIKEIDPDGGGPAPAALYIGHSSFQVEGRFDTAAGSDEYASGLVTFDGTHYHQTPGGIARVNAVTAFTPAAGTRAIYASGSPSWLNYSETEPYAVFRLNGSSWQSIGAVSGGGDGVASVIDALETATINGQPSLIAAGVFRQIGGVNSSFVARYNGTSWVAMDAGLPTSSPGQDLFITAAGGNAASSVAVLNGVPYLAIQYAFMTTSFPFETSAHTRAIYRWNDAASSWQLVTNQIPTVVGNTGLKLAVVDIGGGPSLYAYGTFISIGGVSGADHIARWNGTAFEPVGNGFQVTAQQSQLLSMKAVGAHDFGNGPRLVALLATNNITFPVKGLLTLEGGQWQSVTGGATLISNTPIATICSSTNPAWGGLYIGGDFRAVGGTFNQTTGSGGLIESRGIARLITTCPVTCPADFNGDGARDVADLFAYINAWLAKTANADFNDSGSVDVADLFAYINAWLAGC